MTQALYLLWTLKIVEYVWMKKWAFLSFVCAQIVYAVSFVFGVLCSLVSNNDLGNHHQPTESQRILDGNSNNGAVIGSVQRAPPRTFAPSAERDSFNHTNRHVPVAKAASVKTPTVLSSARQPPSAHANQKKLQEEVSSAQ